MTQDKHSQSGDAAAFARRLSVDVDELDDVTRRRLRLSRQAALNDVAERSYKSGMRGWGYAAAAASIALIAVLMLRPAPSPDAPGELTVASAEAMTDLELLAEEEELALLEELDFFRWLGDLDEDLS